MKQKLIGLVALMAALGALVVVASSAAAEEAEAPESAAPEAVSPEAVSPEAVIPATGGRTAAVIGPIAAAEVAPLSLEQCSQGTVCAYENNNWSGQFSWWAGSDTGCHNHLGNPKIRSGWNRTQHFVWYGTVGVPKGEGFWIPEGQNPVTGKICWE